MCYVSNHWQLAAFNDTFSIPTQSINEDTPNDDQWWKVGNFQPLSTIKLILGTFKTQIYDKDSRKLGLAKWHLLVTVEQLFKNEGGHLTRFGQLIRNSSDVRKSIKLVNVDEAHFVPTAGIARHGAPAHRPSWGRLNELKQLLPHAVFRGFSATMPPHMLEVVEKSFLRPKYTMIQTT